MLYTEWLVFTTLISVTVILKYFSMKVCVHCVITDNYFVSEAVLLEVCPRHDGERV